MARKRRGMSAGNAGSLAAPMSWRYRNHFPTAEYIEHLCFCTVPGMVLKNHHDHFMGSSDLKRRHVN